MSSNIDPVERGTTAPAWDARRWVAWTVSFLGVLAVPACWAALATHRDGSCRNLHLVADYAGSSDAFTVLTNADGTARCGLDDLSDARWHLVLGLLFAIGYGALLFEVCTVWWKRAWLTKPFAAGEPVRWLAVVAAGLDVLTIGLVLVGLHLDTGDGPSVVTVSDGVARVLPVLSWIKVFAFIAVWVASVGTLTSAFSRRRLTHVESTGEPLYDDAPVGGLGIACSGGGIRAASLTLGALGVLERHTVGPPPGPEGAPTLQPATGTQGLLYQATYLTSVSGGGYAAGSWRAASASGESGPVTAADDDQAFTDRWPGGVVGDPFRYPDVPPQAADSHVGPGDATLYRHLQQRREFLRSGRGGLPAALVVALAFLCFHLLLIASFIVAVAWPVGRLAATWFVLDDDPAVSAASIVSAAGRQAPLEARLYGPALCFAVLAAVVFVTCLFQWNTDRRRRSMAIGWSLTAAAVVWAFLLIGVPWALDVAYPYIDSHANIRAITALTSAGGALGIAISVVTRLAKPHLMYLGGVLLAFGAAVLAIEVAGQAATGEGFFSLTWAGSLRGVPSWAALVAGLVIAYLVLCPRWWSLHTLYRNRLRLGFVTTREPSKAPRGLRRHDRVDLAGGVEEPTMRMWPVRKDAEMLLSDYGQAPGPQHLVCCSAARADGRATGVRALSFVIDPDHVELHEIDYTPTGLVTRTHRSNTAQWVQALGSPRARAADGTVSAAMSVSGAAVAPAMGRLDKGSTNSLLAALNLRLGTWYPNPRYVPTSGDDVRYPWVRLSYVLKELLGLFDMRDHHLYVTDGGHRENLGLVELLRRRCTTIICIDSSGDTPGSFNTLRQAVEMARIEVRAEVDLTSLPPATAARPMWAHHVLPVSYRAADGTEIGTGTVIHISAVLFTRAPDDLLAYGLEDPRFPNYSTGDQFLTEEQFRRLVLFGRAAARTALEQDEVRRAIAAALA